MGKWSAPLLALVLVAPGESAARSALADLASIPLTTQSLQENEAIRARAALDLDLQLLEYVVQCALRSDQSFTIDLGTGPLELSGDAGYAPGWGEGPCDEACQEWVSACLLARTNGFGVPARVFLESPEDPPGAGEDALASGFSVQEGAFFGNVFQEPWRMYSCRGRGRDPFYDAVRVCTHPGSLCGTQAVGPCLDEDEAVPSVCEALLPGGAFTRCHTLPSRGGTFPAEGRVYERVITVYLPATGFSAGADAMCGGDDPSEHPVRGPGDRSASAGRPCRFDDDCTPGFSCSLRTGPGFCSRPCEVEGEPCGEGAICATLPSPIGAGQVCATQCRARIAGGGGCPEGQVCTASHVFAEVAGPTACGGFCQDDGDCGGGHCSPRTGKCGVEQPALPGALADGEPCTSESFCRGFCIPFTADGGICASLVPYAGTGTTCPDPGVQPSFADTGEDDMGVCVFRGCSELRDQCTPPLACVAGQCTYPG